MNLFAFVTSCGLAGGMAIAECSMVVDTSPLLLATPERMLVPSRFSPLYYSRPRVE